MLAAVGAVEAVEAAGAVEAVEAALAPSLPQQPPMISPITPLPSPTVSVKPSPAAMVCPLARSLRCNLGLLPARLPHSHWIQGDRRPQVRSPWGHVHFTSTRATSGLVRDPKQEPKLWRIPVKLR